MSINFHFLDVGDGDCTIVDFPDRVVKEGGQKKAERIMMIDIHHHDDHAYYENIINYFKENFRNVYGVRSIFRYVMSHPHMDHMKGLDKLLDEIDVVNFWDVEHEFQPIKEGDRWELYKYDWQRYEQVRESESDPKVLRYTDDSSPVQYWDEDRIEILSPSKELFDYVHKTDDGTKRTKEEIGALLNNLSYVLLLYVNDLKVLLPGDAEPRCWDYIIENHKEKIRDIDILKAPHHGRESAFHEEAVKLMNPKHIIFSASDECEYLVPEKYKKAAPNALQYNTAERGTIILECGFDGEIKLA